MKENILKWMGGKHALAPYIIEKMPHHTKYVEVFGGALHVFFQKPLASKMNVVNDINENLCNMYKALKDPIIKEQVEAFISNMLYDRNLFNHLQRQYADRGRWSRLSLAERAFAFIYLNRTSFNGKALDYAKRTDPSVVYDLKPLIDKVFRKLQEGDVVIENLPFQTLLKESKNHFDKEEVFIYLDPPYWVTTDSKGADYYEYKMSKSEHEEMRDILASYKDAKWMISYDDEAHIKKLYEGCSIIQTPKICQTSGNAIAGQLDQEPVYKSEILIGNHELETEGTLFGQ